jgi:hypothetical protein
VKGRERERDGGNREEGKGKRGMENRVSAKKTEKDENPQKHTQNTHTHTLSLSFPYNT